jgi:hypothetical protein
LPVRPRCWLSAETAAHALANVPPYRGARAALLHRVGGWLERTDPPRVATRRARARTCTLAPPARSAPLCRALCFNCGISVASTYNGDVSRPFDKQSKKSNEPVFANCLPSKNGEAPSTCARSLVFARCVPATGVPRKSDHTREAAAGWDGSGNLPPVTRRRDADLWRARMRNAQRYSEFLCRT